MEIFVKMFDEEESKRLRIFQRHERQELQLIIERCNEVAFDYICLPSVRTDDDLCFGSKKPRKIHLFADDKSVNSYMRKIFKENFPEPKKPPEMTKSDDEDEGEIDFKPSYPFSSKVPRFQDINIDSSGVYRKKRAKEVPVVDKKNYSPFGSSSLRNLLVMRTSTESITPGVGTYNLTKKTTNSAKYSFGDIKMKAAYDIVCTPINLDIKCDFCEEKPKNIFWKNQKTQSVLCRQCYNQKFIDIKQKTRGIVDKLRKLQILETDFRRKRYCDFYHEHNMTTAAVRLLPPKDFHRRIKQENRLNHFFNY